MNIDGKLQLVLHKPFTALMFTASRHKLDMRYKNAVRMQL